MSMHLVFPSGKVYRVVNNSMPAFSFQDLSDDDETPYRTWAQAQPEGTVINPVWHPAAQDELLTSGRGREASE